MKNTMLILTALLLGGTAQAQRVRQGTLNEKTLMLEFESHEVQVMQNDASQVRLFANQAATRALMYTGLTESVTGKVASVPVHRRLVTKYERDIQNALRRTPRGGSFTLIYHTDVDRLKNLARAANEAENLRPEDEVSSRAIDLANDLVNARMEQNHGGATQAPRPRDGGGAR